MGPAGNVQAFGYSGKGQFKNDPRAEQIHNEGPLPGGMYDMDGPHDTVTHGPFVIRLTPRPETQMYGREGMLIHGDSMVDPGNASEGCIIVPRTAREAVIASKDLELLVV